MTAPLITAPGIYCGISNADYHGLELCPEHSIHGSGLVKIEDKSCAHYWAGSIHNPKAKPREQKEHFSLGHLLHDILLYKGFVPAEYHIVPDGFTPAHHQKWAAEMEGYEAATKAGMNILHKSSFDLARDMAEACDKHPLAAALLTSGKPEVTAAAQDPLTGRWMLTRADILPETNDIIPDVKGAASVHPDDYEKAATRWGYHMWAAHCLDILDLTLGEKKRQFCHIAIEKEPPHVVEIYALDDGDIHEARMLNRRALNLFDRSRLLRAGAQDPAAPADRLEAQGHPAPGRVRRAFLRALKEPT
jgi:hypothetical protein